MNTLNVQKRNMETKAKKLRREGYVTGNLFGKEFDGSIPLAIEKKEAERIQRECYKGSQLTLALDGKKYAVLLKEIDYNPMKRQILEMDFQALVKGEKVHSVAEIILHNQDKIVEGILEQHLSEVSYKATAEWLMDRIDVDCSDLKVGDTLRVSDLEVAQNHNIELMTHTDTLVASVIASKNDVAADDAKEEAAAVAAEATEA